METLPITLHAVLVKVANTQGGGFKISFDVPQTDLSEVKELLDMIDYPCVLAIASERQDYAQSGAV